ncbi:MAG TPA: HutD family protein [Roseiflexaceae bacterium]|nr:HutD family protein [Roseiflexaceae bacterium]
MNGRVVRQSEQPRASWAGGITQALFAWPAAALQSIRDAQAWAGTATIERDAPYSYLPGLQRVHMPISGNGLVLHFERSTETTTLKRLQQHRFDGARPLHAHLIDGPVLAFNLLAHSDVTLDLGVLQVTPERTRLTAGTQPELHARLVQVVYVVSGTLTIEPAGEAPLALDAGDAYVLEQQRQPGAAMYAATSSEVVVATLALPPAHAPQPV